MIWSAIVAILFVGAIFGSLSLSFIADRFGRKRGLYFSLITTEVASILSIVSLLVNSFELYSLSRILIGYSIGLSLGLSAIYLNESSPKECRGTVSMMIGLMVQFGTVIGSIVAMSSIFGTINRLWYIYLLECILLLSVIVLLPFMPESPGYLTLLGNEEAARQAIIFFYNCDISAAENVIVEIKETMKQRSKALNLCEVWSGERCRRGNLIGIVIAVSMAFSGIAVINAYAVDILRESGLSLMNASIGNIILSTVSLVAIVVSSLMVEKFGRRPLLLTTNAIILALNLVIFSLMLAFRTFQYSWIGYALIAVISLFIIAFAMGPGPLCYFVTSEMVDQNARAAAQGWASFTQMFCRTILLAIYLPLSNQIGQPFAYVTLFVLPLIVAILILYFNMPETKNKNINEVLEAAAQLPKLWRRQRATKAVADSSNVLTTISKRTSNSNGLYTIS